MYNAVAARKIHKRSSADGPVETITDLPTLRGILYKYVPTSPVYFRGSEISFKSLQRPFFEPKNIVCSPHREGGKYTVLLLPRRC